MNSPLPDRNSADRGRWLPLVATCLGTFLLLVYATIVTVALPRIAGDLHADFGALQWIVDVYTLALAGLLLGMGSLGDTLGRKRLYLLGLAVFTLATLACGTAPSAPLLIAARAAQGIAGAAMFATLLPLIGLTYSGRDRARAFAVWGAVAGAAAGVGNVAGGMLTQFLSWRWLFHGAVPLCLATLLLSWKVLAADARTPARVDWPGIAAFTVAATGVTFGFVRGGERGWGDPGTLVGFAVGAAALLVLVLVERASAHPMLPLALFRTPAFNGLLTASGTYYPAAFGFLPVLSLWLQHHAGLGAFATSLVLTAQPLAFFVTSALAGSALHRVPARWAIAGGCLLVGIGDLTLLGAQTGPSWPVLLPGLVLTGAGAGLVSPVLPATAMAAAPPAHSGVAAAAANGARQLGLALGIALLGTAYAAAGLSAVFLLAGALALLGALLTVLLGRPRRPAEPLRTAIRHRAPATGQDVRC
ncbi:MFS transporter [Streptomyces gilvosporeus]|uniref:MFS transporter n=1 Tax=Streptomyces gilvosporeus TaxID=553510 RepID=A0A1V0TM50_9ACTN|nr:MFS transporter [Streptomyces gilvosporeus]ARF54001.1 MFS transporter [Streptomyces gilvosporeus]